MSLIPAVARAIQRRDFGSATLRDALASGRLMLLQTVPLEDEVTTVAAVVRDLRAENLEVAVFTHHNDMLARLSDGLERDGIEHEIAGLSDALAAALDAQAAMLHFAAGTSPWSDVLKSLAVFVASAQRGSKVPPLAWNILRETGATTLQSRVVDLALELEGSPVHVALSTVAGAHRALGLPSKSSAWDDASTLMATMHARAVRRLGKDITAPTLTRMIAAESREATYESLTESVVRPHPVQLMNLYQTKGREADATVVVLREGDWMGDEGEPWPTTSRLLYVVFSRARERIIVLPVGDNLHPAVQPLRLLGD